MKNLTLKGILIGLLFSSPLSMTSQVLDVDSICVNVENPGDLAKVVEKIDKANVQYLKIVGKLSNNDLQVLTIFPNIKSIYLEDAVYVISGSGEIIVDNAEAYGLPQVARQYYEDVQSMWREVKAKKEFFVKEFPNLSESSMARWQEELDLMVEKLNTCVLDAKVKVIVAFPKLPDLENLFIFAHAEDREGLKIPFSVAPHSFKIKNGIIYPSNNTKAHTK